MKKQTPQEIVIIGCGNVAWHLAKHLSVVKQFKVLIYNHGANKALNDFKTKLKCSVSDNLNDISTRAAFYFICVSDRAITQVSRLIHANHGALVIHTSGSKSIKELMQQNSAVFYPVQTFSKHDSVNWTETPILIEASDKNNYLKLEKLASLFSKKIIRASSSERFKIHLAAVIVNNFTNALYVAADNFMNSDAENENLKFNLLLPLIRQTTAKLERLSPLEAQTGPAKRNDKETLKKHTQIIKDKELKKLYKKLSALIQHQQTSSHA
jgi:predicted short-subunit dehydrogenase-like oxidoreductase (DUF2520 family)